MWIFWEILLTEMGFAYLKNLHDFYALGIICTLNIFPQRHKKLTFPLKHDYYHQGTSLMDL